MTIARNRLLLSAFASTALIAAGSAKAAPFLDTFDTDSSSDYTLTRVLTNNAGSGAVVATIDGSDSNVANFTNPTRSAGVDQSLYLHNTAGLAIGETVLVDPVFGTSGGVETLALAVSLGAPTADVREDYALVAWRPQSGGQMVRQSFTGTSEDAAVEVGLADNSVIASYYIERVDEDNFSLGYVTTSDVAVEVDTYSNASFTSAEAKIGFYTDTRSSSFSQSADNLRVVPEPGSLALLGLGGLLIARRRRG